MNDDNDILTRIKERVLALEPEAEVILFGSRARGDARADSDWDLLILLDGKVDESRKQPLRMNLYDLEVDTGTVIVPVFREKAKWGDDERYNTSFKKNVKTEGVTL